MQAQGSLGGQDAGHSFIQAFGGDDAILDALQHKAIVFFQVAGKQEHIGTAGNAFGHSAAAAHGQGVARHRGGISADQAVEAQFPAQQALHHLTAQGTGHDVLILDTGVQAASPGGLHDMAHHGGQGTGFNTSFVGCAIGVHPGIAIHAVDRSDQVLVALVLAVTGEVLDGSGKAHLLHFFHISTAHAAHPLRVAAKGTGVGDGVAVVRVNINNGSKSPVCANGAGFGGTGMGHLGGHADIIRCGNFHRCTDQRTLGHNSVAAFFQVGGDQWWHLAAAINVLGGGDGALGGHHSVHTSARFEDIEHILKLLGFTFLEQHTEQLASLFFGGHAGQGSVHPFNIFRFEVKWFRSQVDHNSLPLSNSIVIVHKQFGQGVGGQAVFFVLTLTEVGERAHARPAGQQAQHGQNCLEYSHLFRLLPVLLQAVTAVHLFGGIVLFKRSGHGGQQTVRLFSIL